MSVCSEMVRYTEPKTHRHGFESDQLTFFVIPFSLIVLIFLSLFFPSLFCSFLLFFFVYFQHYFFIIFNSLIVYFKLWMQKIRHKSQTSPSVAMSVFESNSSLSAFPWLAVSVPELFETNMTNGWSLSSVGMSRVPVSTIN